MKKKFQKGLKKVSSKSKTPNNVTQPGHYTSHPSGVECIDISEHMTANLAAAFQYIWRCELKGKHEEDLRKAIFYLEREINRVKKFKLCVLDEKNNRRK